MRDGLWGIPSRKRGHFGLPVAVQVLHNEKKDGLTPRYLSREACRGVGCNKLTRQRAPRCANEPRAICRRAPRHAASCPLLIFQMNMSHETLLRCERFSCKHLIPYSNLHQYPRNARHCPCANIHQRYITEEFDDKGRLVEVPRSSLPTYFNYALRRHRRHRRQRARRVAPWCGATPRARSTPSRFADLMRAGRTRRRTSWPLRVSARGDKVMVILRRHYSVLGRGPGAATRSAPSLVPATFMLKEHDLDYRLKASERQGRCRDVGGRHRAQVVDNVFDADATRGMAPGVGVACDGVQLFLMARAVRASGTSRGSLSAARSRISMAQAPSGPRAIAASSALLCPARTACLPPGCRTSWDGLTYNTGVRAAPG